MSVFSKIANFFKSLFQSPLLKKFTQFLFEVFTEEKALIMAQLQDIALLAVKKAQQQFTDPQEKNSEAVKEVLEYAKIKGIIVGQSLVKTLIELAYQKLKPTFDTPVQPGP
jgi:hypothetical protein